MGRDVFAIWGGKREERGGEWGMRGREVGIEGAGSGDRVPPVNPHIFRIVLDKNTFSYP